jgi:hypothetical protein
MIRLKQNDMIGVPRMPTMNRRAARTLRKTKTARIMRAQIKKFKRKTVTTETARTTTNRKGTRKTLSLGFAMLLKIFSCTQEHTASLQ